MTDKPEDAKKKPVKTDATPEVTPTPPPATPPMTPAVSETPPPTAEMDPIVAKLAEWEVTDADTIGKIRTLGPESAEDLLGIQEPDLISVGVPVLKARKICGKIFAAKPVPAASDDTRSATTMLETLPSDDELLMCTKASGILTVPRARVVMAGRCMMANATGMLGLDKVIVKRIDNHYKNEITEEVPTWFWEMANQVSRKQYAPVFNAMEMKGGSRYATPKARNAFWAEMKSDFFPKLQNVQTQLEAWYQQWITKATAMSGLQIGAAMSNLSGGGGAPGMAIPTSGIPPTNMVIASVEALIDVTQKLFAGTQRAVAIAIETDAKVVRELLRRPDLHMHMGMASRQIMLRDLKVSASSDVIQMESIFATYLMNVLKVPEMPPSQSTAYFLTELCDLGTQLKFGTIGGGLKTSGVGGGNDDDLIDDDDDWDDERPETTRSSRRPGGIGGGVKQDPFRINRNETGSL